MTIATQANGGFLFTRDVGNITVNTTNVERVEVDGRGGNDSIDGSGQTNVGVVLDISGGTGDDSLLGGAGGDSLDGGDGNDTMIGNRGNDTASGGLGNDSFTWNPGDGNDLFDGGAGTDTLIFKGANVAEVMAITDLGGGFRFTRNVGSIIVDTTNVERVDVDGLDGADSIDGSGQTNIAVALEISGGAGNDTLIGGAGNDSISGDADNDIVDGGAGNDTLTGGLGGDTFVFGGATANGVTETDLIIGYSETEGDLIDADVASNTVVGGNLQLTLAGGDNDIVVLQGITNINDVTFVL
nr:calcium-binding protein [Microvirga tunisiensis]